MNIDAQQFRTLEQEARVRITHGRVLKSPHGHFIGMNVLHETSVEGFKGSNAPTETAAKSLNGFSF